MKEIELFTDGACKGNPGPGGWCAILRYNGHEKILCGASEHTTNNRMELTAVIEGLCALKEKCSVVCTSDSKYICDAVNKHWLEAWQERNWKRASGDAVLNPELWQKLSELLKKHDVKFIWIKGHNGHPENELCDKIAVEQSQKYIVHKSNG